MSTYHNTYKESTIPPVLSLVCIDIIQEGVADKHEIPIKTNQGNSNV